MQTLMLMISSMINNYAVQLRTDIREQTWLPLCELIVLGDTTQLLLTLLGITWCLNCRSHTTAHDIA